MDEENYRLVSILPLLKSTNIWSNIWIVCCLVLEKLIPLNTLYLDLYKNDKMN